MLTNAKNIFIKVVLGKREPLSRSGYWTQVMNVILFTFGLALITLGPVAFLESRLDRHFMHSVIQKNLNSFGSLADTSAGEMMSYSEYRNNRPTIIEVLEYVCGGMQILFIIGFGFILRRPLIDRLKDAKIIYPQFVGNVAAVLLMLNPIIFLNNGFFENLVIIAIAGCLPQHLSAKSELQVKPQESKVA